MFFFAKTDGVFIGYQSVFIMKFWYTYIVTNEYIKNVMMSMILIEKIVFEYVYQIPRKRNAKQAKMDVDHV